MNTLNYKIHLILHSKYKLFYHFAIISFIYFIFFGDKIIYCTNEKPIIEFAAPISCGPCGSLAAPSIDLSSTKRFTTHEISLIQSFLDKPENVHLYSTEGLKTWKDILTKGENERTEDMQRILRLLITGNVNGPILNSLHYGFPQFDPALIPIRRTLGLINIILRQRGVSGY